MVTNSVAVLQRENARLQDENEALQEELREMRGFVDILTTLASAEDDFDSDEELLPLLRDMFNHALDLLNAPAGSLLLLDDEQNELQFVLTRGSVATELLGYRIPADQGIAGWIVTHRKPALVRDVRRDNRFSSHIDESFRFMTQSIAAVPIIGNHRIYGVMEALNQPVDEPFSDTDLRLLSLVCRFTGEILANIDHNKPT
jgi:GAF domain-containing protein